MYELASLYAAGAMETEASAELEKIANSQPELLHLMGNMQEIAARLAVALSDQGFGTGVVPVRKKAIFSEIETRMPSVVTRTLGLSVEDAAKEPIVVTRSDNTVQWVSAAFSEMCGHALEDLRGRKLAPILQGKETDPKAVDAMRQAIRRLEPVTQDLVNYHKDGSSYRVSVHIEPVLDAGGKPLCFIAREKLLS